MKIESHEIYMKTDRLIQARREDLAVENKNDIYQIVELVSVSLFNNILTFVDYLMSKQYL